VSERKNKFVKVLLWILGILILLVIILQLIISGIVTKKANDFLAEKAKIGRININLFGGSVNVKNLVVFQPDGFGETNLIQLGKLSARVRYLPILQKKIVVSYVNVSNVKADIQKTDDEMNLQKVVDDLTSSAGANSGETKSTSDFEVYVKKVNLRNIALKYTEQSDSLGTQHVNLEGINSQIRKIRSSGTRNLVNKVTLAVDRTIVSILDLEENTTQLEVENFTTKIENIVSDSTFLQIPTLHVSYDSLYLSAAKDTDTTIVSMPEFILTLKDLQTTGQNITLKEALTDSFEVSIQLPDSVNFQLYNLNLLAKDINVSQDSLVKPAEATFTGKILNEELGDNLFGIFAQINVIPDKFPTVDAFLQIVGLELEPIKPMIPPGTFQALGGDAFDLSAKLAICDSSLDCDIDISMIQGSKLGMKIGGTPAKPELDTSSVLFNVFSRFGGGIGSGFSKLGGTTFGAAKTSLTTALGLGKGAANVVGSLGKGVFKSVKGVVTLDASEIGEGLKTTTVGTVKEAGKTVLDTGGNLIEGTGDTLGEASGKATASDWRNAKAARWIELWDKAKTTIKEK